jgi:hypothetical protein
VAYVKGELQSTYAAPFDRTWRATLAALRDADMKVTDTQRDSTQGTITATSAKDETVRVNLEQAGPGTTAVKIRVGVFGDEEVSRALHRRIASRLGTPRS